MHTCIVGHNIDDVTWIVANSWKFTRWFHQPYDQHLHDFVFLTILMHNIIIIKTENGGESSFPKTKTNYCNYFILMCLTSLHCLHNILQNEWGNYLGKPMHEYFHQFPPSNYEGFMEEESWSQYFNQLFEISHAYPKISCIL